jgi:hypothetical protein
VKKGQIIPKEQLNNAILMGKGDLGFDNRTGFAALSVYKAKPGFEKVFGGEFFLTATRKKEENHYFVDKSNDSMDILQKRRRIARFCLTGNP